MGFDFGKKLKELRAGREVTQETLANHLQISPQAVSKWERGEGYPDVARMKRQRITSGINTDRII